MLLKILNSKLYEYINKCKIYLAKIHNDKLSNKRFHR